MLTDERRVEIETAIGELEVAKSAVDHPAHYNVGGVEVIDAIEAWGLGFALGNAVKYIARCDHKDDPITDLRKAAWYIEHEIERRARGAGQPEGMPC
jgi:hypothetical protein